VSPAHGVVIHPMTPSCSLLTGGPTASALSNWRARASGQPVPLRRGAGASVAAPPRGAAPNDSIVMRTDRRARTGAISARDEPRDGAATTTQCLSFTSWRI
jgi:hypothetical protein